MPRITTASVFVDDQAKALAFYTDILGFLPKTDVPVGEHRWLTVVSDEEPDGVELLLEPDEHPAAKAFTRALAADGIPATSFGVADVDAWVDRHVQQGADYIKVVIDLPGFDQQTVDALVAVRRLTGRNRLVFPGQRQMHKPLCENAIGYLYNRVGFHGRHVPHGWRAAFSTTMNALAKRRRRHEDQEVIELMLAHVPENKVKAAYDRAAHMERRRELSQEWADLLTPGLAAANDLLDGARR